MEVEFGKYIANRINELNIKHVFGVPGSYIMPVWQEIASQINLVLACHETGAGFMAEGYSRGTNQLSVLLTTSAPGVTNAVTAIANAYMDSVPMLIISGQVNTFDVGHGAFQECSKLDRSFSQQDLLKPITKIQIEINDIENAQFLFENALYIAISGRPGPVHISIPVNIQTQKIKVSNDKIFNINSKNNFNMISIPSDVLEMINDADKPLLYVGWGTYLSNCIDNLNKFSELLKAPIVTSMKGIASVSPDNKYYVGHIGLGMNSNVVKYIENYSPNLIIVLGSSLSSRTVNIFESIFANSKILNINIEVDTVKRYKTFDVQGDINNVLKSIIPYVKEKSENRVQVDIKKLRDNYSKSNMIKVQNNKLNMGNAILSLNKYIDKNTVIFPDSGNHWLDSLSLLELKNRGAMFLSMGLATMGYSFGSAIGYALSDSDKKVVVIGGDGSFLMSGNEIITAIHKCLNMIIIIVNNQSLGRVRVYQSTKEKPHFNTSDIDNVDYANLAKSFGFNSFKVKNITELDKVYSIAFRSKEPVFIELVVDKDDIPVCLRRD